MPALGEACGAATCFHATIRTKTADGLDPWIEAASDGLVAFFARGVTKDINAERAVTSEPWSTGQTGAQA